MEIPQLFFSKSELALRNGQDMEMIWIAYMGIIYEVSKSRYWKKGFHYEHWAGQDLSPELKDAPHGERVFEQLIPVGYLK
jgi:predicted heme/steroid binding protein